MEVPAEADGTRKKGLALGLTLALALALCVCDPDPLPLNSSFEVPTGAGVSEASNGMTPGRRGSWCAPDCTDEYESALFMDDEVKSRRPGVESDSQSAWKRVDPPISPRQYSTHRRLCRYPVDTKPSRLVSSRLISSPVDD